MNVGCAKCQNDAQLIADVNEFEREIKILGIPKAIISLAEFALQVYGFSSKKLQASHFRSLDVHEKRVASSMSHG